MMRHARAVRGFAMALAAGCAAAALAGCAEDDMSPAAGTRSPAQEGRLIAQRECARCHAIGAVGGSPRPDAPPLRAVLEDYNPGRIRMAFQEGLIIGHPDMPVFGFSDQQIDWLLAYLEDIEE